jgi:DnaK suppressor protein
VSKPPAKAAAVSKTPAKTAPKAAPAQNAAKAVAKAAAAAAPKSAEKAAAMPAEKPAAKTPANVAPPPAPVPKTAAPKSAAKTAIKPDPKTAAPALPTPTPAPQANRFTDRFAPAVRPAPSMTPTTEHFRPAHKADPKLVNAWKSKPGRELTEPELLAMPESEYMNDKQLDFFRARLDQQRNELLSSAGETTEHLREDTSIVPDPVDRATIEEEHALELRTRDRERKLLKKISQSLSRIDNGEYGYCDETGEPIGLARLLARPTATLSLEAQQRREMKQKMFGD